jgi:hypothetical protein
MATAVEDCLLNNAPLLGSTSDRCHLLGKKLAILCLLHVMANNLNPILLSSTVGCRQC